jgi:L,D-transpeptidase YcbB
MERGPIKNRQVKRGPFLSRPFFCIAMKHGFRLLFLLLFLFPLLSVCAQPDPAPAPLQAALLRQALDHYQRMAYAGGWTSIRPDTCLSPGNESSYILPLRANLLLAGDLLPEQDSGRASFDPGLEQAVRRFQRRHGLAEDGLVGEQTLTALNVPLQQRITQLLLNLERWEQFQPDSTRPYVLVNIPDYSLRVVEQGEQTVLRMRVIVGKPSHPTVVMDDLMTKVVLRPAWYVPASIARQEILPMLRRDPHYLAKNNMKLFRVTGNKRTEIDPAGINWATLSPATFDYLVVQQPGPRNALGQIKFLFPNVHNIYLHDTPEKRLFQNRFRTYSHGCVRVENPVGLATYLLRQNAGWSRDAIESWIKKGPPEKEINLMNPVPVHLNYFTAWAAEDGTLHFRPDVYRLDIKKPVLPEPAFSKN